MVLWRVLANTIFKPCQNTVTIVNCPLFCPNGIHQEKLVLGNVGEICYRWTSGVTEADTVMTAWWCARGMKKDRYSRSHNRGWLCVHCLICFSRKWRVEGKHDLYSHRVCGVWGGQGMWRLWWRIEMHTERWQESLEVRHLEDLGIDGSIVLEMDL